MKTKEEEREPLLGRWRYVIAAVAALAAAGGVLVPLPHAGGPPPDQMSRTESRGSLPPDSPSSSVHPSPSPAAPATPTPPAAVTLGRDLQPDSSTPCHAENNAQGAAWRVGPVRMRGRDYETAYQCALFAGASGSIDVALGGAWHELRLFAGFADAPAATDRVYRLEVVGDGKDYLSKPATVAFGNVVDLTVDVTNVTRLRLAIREVGLGPPGGDEAPSNPVLANVTLRR